MNLSSKQRKAEYQRKWRAKNKDRSNELILNAKAKKPEKYKALQKAKYERWKKEKPEALKAMRKKASKKHNLKRPWLIYNHRESVKIQHEEWKKTHPENMRIIRKKAKAKRRNVEGSYSLAEWNTLLVQYGYTCPCCFKKNIDLHADHIIPIIKGGSNYIENIQPLCKVCNSRKYTKIIKYDVPLLTP